LQGGALQESPRPTLDLAGQQAAMARAMAGAGLAGPSPHHPQLMVGLPGAQAIPQPTANLLAHPLFAGAAATQQQQQQQQQGASQQPGAGMILLPRLP